MMLRSRHYATPILAITTLLLEQSAYAAPLSKADLRCVSSTARAATKLINTRVKESQKCLKLAFRGKEASPNSCSVLDPKNKVAKANRGVIDQEAKFCDEFPPYGHTTGIYQAEQAEMTGFTFFTSGVGYLPSELVSGFDKDQSKCFLAIENARAGLLRAQIVTANDLWKDKEALAEIENYSLLSEALRYKIETDEKGKIGKARERVDKTLAKRCSKVNLADVVKGDCESRASDASACFEEQARCNLCRGLNSITWGSINCDTFDNASPDLSCPSFSRPGDVEPGKLFPPDLVGGGLPALSIGTDGSLLTFHVTSDLRLGSASPRLTLVTVESETGLQLAALSDFGDGPDVESHDGIYAGTMAFGGGGLQPGDCAPVKSVMRYPGGRIESETREFCATAQPLGLALGNGTVLSENDVPISDDRNLFVTVAEGFTEADLVDAANANGAKIVGSLVDIGVYQLELDPPAADLGALETAIEDLRDESALASVSANLALEPKAGFGAYEAAEFRTTSNLAGRHGYLARIRADEAWFLSKGVGVNIAVFDTGLDPTDPFGDPIENFDDTSETKVLPVWCPAGQTCNPGDLDDSTFHGTAAAALAAAPVNEGTNDIVGVAPDASLISYRVFRQVPAQGGGYEIATNYADVLAAIRSLSRTRVDVANLSFGPPCPGDTLGSKATMCSAIASMQDRTLFVAAAGNESSEIGDNYIPASCSGVLVVGGTMHDSGKEVRWTTTNPTPGNCKDAGGNPLLYGSNYGPHVDLAAPAEDLPDVLGGSRSGTSFAAPLVSGAAAVLFFGTSPLEMTPSEVREQLIAGAAELADTGLGGRFLDVFESLTNAGFERDKPRGAGSGSPWLGSTTWNEFSFSSPLGLPPVLPEEDLPAPMLAPQDRDLVQIVETFGDIAPTDGSAFALLRNGILPISSSTEPPPLDGGKSETLDLYDTGVLHWTLFPFDLGEANELPFSFDWALVAEVPGADVGCVGPGTACSQWTVGYPADMDLCLGGPTGEACSSLAHNSFETSKQPSGNLYINAFPTQSTTADLALTAHSARWTGWQQVSDSVAASSMESYLLAFRNSPVGFRFYPEFDQDSVPTANWQDWDRERTNFALLVDNFALRTKP